MTKEHLMGCRRSLPHQPAVEPDAIRLAHSHAELCELAVDGETPRAYPALDLAPGAEPDVGERLLQPLSGLLPHAGPRLPRHGASAVLERPRSVPASPAGPRSHSASHRRANPRFANHRPGNPRSA